MRVPSDPAQVIVSHASFRVKFGAGAPLPRYGADDTAPMPVLPTSVRSAAEARTRRRRSAPLVWSGRTEPGDPAATQLLQAVRGAGATQVMPRVTEEMLPGAVDEGMPRARASVVAPRSPVLGTPPPAGTSPWRPPSAGGPYGTGPQDGRGDAYGDSYDDEYGDGYETDPDAYDEAERRYRERRRGEPVRHAWYPGRRMNLGVVLLPLRVFLGLICVYAGLGKLCDPVYFDGGVRGSMVHWLGSLHPWSLAEPLRSAALGHPVGAGLTVAFLQVAVGVLTVLGLWQRMAASIGALLSVALLVTVSWRTVPVYDAPDIIYLAAWSPLVIAGAPVYSIDSKLAGEAWRRLGPRAPLWQLRRYVVRRGVVLATLVAGGTLVVGALFGSAVRASSSHVDSPSTPSDLPTNNLPGSPYPQRPGSGLPGSHGRLGVGGAQGTRPGQHGASPSAGPSTGPGASSAPGLGQVGGGRGLPGRPRTVQPVRPPAPPVRTAPPVNPAPPSGGSSGGGGSLGGLLGVRPTSGFLLGMPGTHRDPGAGSGTA